MCKTPLMKDNDPVWAMATILLTVFGCTYEPVEELALEQYADWLPVSLLIVCVLLSLVLLIVMWRALRIAERDSCHVRFDNSVIRANNNLLHDELVAARGINERSLCAILKYEEERAPRTPRV